MTTSKSVKGSASNQPLTTCTLSSAKGPSNSSSQVGARTTPASVEAMTSPVAAAMARLRPWLMLLPGAAMTCSGSRRR